MMMSEICLGPVPSLLLTNFDKQVFNNISTEGVASRSENKTWTIQKDCPTSKILNRMKIIGCQEKITDSGKFGNCSI